SRVYGIADDSSATASPASARSGRRSAVPAVAAPNGRTTTAAIVVAPASPADPGRVVATRDPAMMYQAHPDAATSAKATPSGSRPVDSPAPSPTPSSTTPASASTTHRTSRMRRDRIAASPSGPRNSMVTVAARGSRVNAP